MATARSFTWLTCSVLVITWVNPTYLFSCVVMILTAILRVKNPVANRGILYLELILRQCRLYSRRPYDYRASHLTFLTWVLGSRSRLPCASANGLVEPNQV